MEELTLRDVQLTQLYIAKEIKRICTKYHIRYFMSDGTLLGAARHKGFIPWDDDMDFGMLAEDYAKFLDVARQELSEEFVLEEWRHSHDYPLPFAKVKLNGTMMDDAVTAKLHTHKGVWVDIFPFVEVSEKNQSSAMFYRKSNLLMKAYLLKNGFNLNAITKNPASRLMNCVLLRLPIKKTVLRQYFENLFHVDTAEQSGSYLQISTVFRPRDVFDKAYFDDLVELSFENELFPAPARYHDLLTHEYGDYMQLPPESQRQTHSVLSVKIDPTLLKKITQQ